MAHPPPPPIPLVFVSSTHTPPNRSAAKPWAVEKVEEGRDVWCWPRRGLTTGPTSGQTPRREAGFPLADGALLRVQSRRCLSDKWLVVSVRCRLVNRKCSPAHSAASRRGLWEYVDVCMFKQGDMVLLASVLDACFFWLLFLVSVFSFLAYT